MRSRGVMGGGRRSSPPPKAVTSDVTARSRLRSRRERRAGAAWLRAAGGGDGDARRALRPGAATSRGTVSDPRRGFNRVTVARRVQRFRRAGRPRRPAGRAPAPRPRRGSSPRPGARRGRSRRPGSTIDGVNPPARRAAADPDSALDPTRRAAAAHPVRLGAGDDGRSRRDPVHHRGADRAAARPDRARRSAGCGSAAASRSRSCTRRLRRW